MWRHSHSATCKSWPIKIHLWPQYVFGICITSDHRSFSSIVMFGPICLWNLCNNEHDETKEFIKIGFFNTAGMYLTRCTGHGKMFAISDFKFDSVLIFCKKYTYLVSRRIKKKTYVNCCLIMFIQKRKTIYPKLIGLYKFLFNLIIVVKYSIHVFRIILRLSLQWSWKKKLSFLTWSVEALPFFCTNYKFYGL